MTYIRLRCSECVIQNNESEKINKNLKWVQMKNVIKLFNERVCHVSKNDTMKEKTLDTPIDFEVLNIY